MLFNPSMEIQTTDNYVDWSSLTSVELICTHNFSSRSTPIGTESDIDVATLGFSTPSILIYQLKLKN